MENVDVKELTVDATLDNLGRVNAFVEEVIGDKPCLYKAKVQLELVVEEIFVNIANYAYDGKTGKAVIRGYVEDEQSRITLMFLDEGVPYNPLAREDPDVNLSVEERKVGGLGIFLVKRNVDDIFYEYKDGKNVLTFRKKLV